MTAEAQKVLQKIRGLQELQKKSGFISTRTQRALLASLSEADLAEVSVALMGTTQSGGAR